MNNYLNFKNGFYIEAGANDGITQSNTYHLQRDLGWRGLLIEPNVHRYKECVNNRNLNSNLIEHCALVSPDHSSPTVRGNFEETNVGESLVSMITSPLNYYDVHQLTAMNDKLNNYKNIEVTACTLQSLIDKNNITKIDFLSLDTEGYEEEAMNGLNFDKNPPTFIRVETSTFEYRKARMHNYMKSKGYAFLGMANDNDCFYGYGM